MNNEQALVRSESAVSPLVQRYESLDKPKRNEIEDLEARALDSQIETAMTPIAVGAVVGFGVAAITGIAPVGVVAGAGFAARAVSEWFKAGKGNDYVRSKGRIAHRLTESDLIRYAKLIGKDAVIGEIIEAKKDNQPLTPAARRLCTQFGVKPQRLTIQGYYDELKALEALPEGVIEGEAIEGEAAAVEVAVIAPSVMDILINPIRSNYFAATARTGKGIMMAMAMDAFKIKHPRGILYTYTPKQDHCEDWYWIPSDQHFNPSLETEVPRSEILAAAQSLHSMILHWIALPSMVDAPKIFILDELSATLSAFKRLKCEEISDAHFGGDKRPFSEWLMDFLVTAASMKQSNHCFVWVSTTLNTIGETGVSAAAIKSLCNYTLVCRNNVKMADGGNATFSAPKIGLDDPLFRDSFTLAYSHDRQAWMTVPLAPEADIDAMAQTRPALKMWAQPPAKWSTASTPTNAPITSSSPVDGSDVDPYEVWEWIQSKVQNSKKRVSIKLLKSWKGGQWGEHIDRQVELSIEDGSLVVNEDGFLSVGPNK